MRLAIDEPERRKAALLGAHDVTHAAQLVIHLGDGEAVLCSAQHIQSLARRLAEGRAPKQNAGAGLVAAANTAAQLVQLREAKALGVLDDHNCGLRNIYANFNNGGSDQQKRIAAAQALHFRIARDR